MSNEFQAISGSDKINVSSTELAARIQAMSSPASQIQEPVQPPQSAEQASQGQQTPPVSYVQPGQGEPVHTQEQKAQVETQTDEQVTFEDLQQKTGIPNPDALAQSYDQLVRKMHSQAQELSRLRSQEAVQPQQFPQQPEQPPQDLNAWLMEGAEKGDLAARIIALNQAMNKPLMENQEEVRFKQEIVRLSSSPSTAEFNLPDVQAEIQKIIQEKPQKYINTATGKIKTDELEDLYYLAKGRLNRPAVNMGAVQKQNQGVGSVIVEGRSKPMPHKPFNPVGASSAELEAYINSL